MTTTKQPENSQSKQFATHHFKPVNMYKLAQ